MGLANKIPDDEVENILDIYWQMLVQVESKVNPRDDVLDKRLVEAAYIVLNRVATKTGHHNNKLHPRWLDAPPK
jgi:hypothetical protein